MTSARGKTSAPVRKMPIKTATVNLEGEYEGWWFKYRTNPRLGPLTEALKKVQQADEDDPQSSAVAIDGMYETMEVVLVDWNFVDEDGAELTPDITGLKALPSELIALMFEPVNKGVQQAPLENSSDS